MATDQEIRDAGFKYVPQQKYLLNPFELPEDQEPVINQGIVNTNAFTGGGGGGFSVFNPDPNSIVNREYRPNYDFRQDREINSKTFNPQPFTDQTKLGVRHAQEMYNKALGDIDAKGLNARTQALTQTRPSQELLDYYGEKILDNQERYRTQGQYVDPYDPRYSSVTEAQKFMDNFPEYYNEPPPSKMEGLLSMLPYVGSLTRGAKFLGDQISPYLPVNRRSILENELGGKGIMVDNIGRIVQGQGDYNTAENIMAGYNANNLTQKSVDKRQGTIEKTLADKYNMSPTDIAAVKAGTYKGPVKTDLIDRYQALDKFGNTLDLTNTRTDKIYDFEEDEKEKKKKDTIVGRFITKRNEKKAIKAAKDAEIAAAAAAAAASGGSGRSYDAPGGVRSSDYNQAANIAGGGGGSKATYQGKTARERTYDGSGTKQGYSQHYAKGGRAGYFYGGRVNFKNGGLASIL